MPLTLKQKGKFNNYYISGTYLGQRVRRCTKTTNRTVAEFQYKKVLKEIEKHVALGDKVHYTFAEAVNFYLRRKEVNPALAVNLKRALEYFKDTPCVDITQARMVAYEDHRYQNKAVKNSSRITACYTPVQSVINFAADYGFAERVKFRKPKITREPIVAAPEDWIAKILSLPLPLWLKASVLICTYQGARPASLAHLTWAHVDFKGNLLTFVRTKNNKVFSPRMHPEVAGILKELWQAEGQFAAYDQRVFPHINPRHPATSINANLKAVCDRHHLDFFTTHKFGRHAFAHRHLDDGQTIETVAKAGGWENSQVVSLYYGHRERSHIDEVICNARIKEENSRF